MSTEGGASQPAPSRAHSSTLFGSGYGGCRMPALQPHLCYFRPSCCN